MNISFQRLFFMLSSIFGLFAALVLAKAILIPLSLALLISFILLPVVKKFEGWGMNKAFAAFLAILFVFIILAGSIALFSNEILGLSDKLSDFSSKIMQTLSDAIYYFNTNFNFIENLNKDDLLENGKAWLKNSSGTLLTNTFNGTASILAGFISVLIFTFLFLIYREGLTKAFIAFGDYKNAGRIFRMLKNIQSVGKKYLSGMFLLIVILGFANSIGLWIIGIDSPFLFGFLAASLSIVPYIGTTIGATLPVLYAFMTTDSLWIPAAIVILFWFIQLIESNFLSPKIVGGSLNVNALVAILSLLIGASVWGVAGMVLFLPFAAMLKVICEEFEELKPVAMLIGSNISNDKESESQPYKWVVKIKKWMRTK